MKSYYIHEYIYEILKFVARQFSRQTSDLFSGKKETCSVDDLEVIDEASFDRNVFNHSALYYFGRQSPIVKAKYGFNFVPNSVMITPHSHYFGHDYSITFYETRSNPPIRFVSVCLFRHDEMHPFYIVEKKNTFALFNHICQVCRDESNYKDKKPIMEESILSTVLKNTIGVHFNKPKIAYYGGSIRRGVLLYGPPGNGKTMLCSYIKSLCQYFGINIHHVTSSTLEDAHACESLHSVVNQNGITFFDDIDLDYFRRKGKHSDIACDLLSAMDGVTSSDYMTINVFTTNEDVADIDEAFLRPGRIDVQIYIDKPNRHLMKRLVNERWHEEVRNNIDLDKLIDLCEGMSFAELEGVKNMMVLNYCHTGKWNMYEAIEMVKQKQGHTKSKKYLFAPPK